MALTFSGFDVAKKRLQEQCDKIAAPDALMADLVEATEPLLQRMAENLEPHRRSNPSAIDSLGIVDASRDGKAAVAVGAIGDNALVAGNARRAPRGGKSRGFILRFLEEGTSKMAARPWCRPAWDAERDSIGARLAAAIRRRLGGAA